ncbi:MAG: ATP/GTP-binding protein [Candidatus Thermoplasmatota archaeon]|nr:ATP/GTP-binding protein [Candidatus Thermoplasmatota archaeon]
MDGGSSLAPKNLLFIGTAGSGKSTLTYAFQLWMQNQGYDSITVNLDPGVEELMYSPDVDVRDWIELSEIMESHGLGPNGAQIAAADLMALNIKEITDVIDGFDTDYVLIDTPGQLELFAFRASSRLLVEALGIENSALAFLFDPALAKTPNGYVSSLMLSATVHFRLPVPMMSLMSKSDLLGDADRERLESWSRDYYSLFTSLMDESNDTQTVVSIEFLQALESIGLGRGVIPVSADSGEGLDDIYSMAQQMLEGGEDIG